MFIYQKLERISNHEPVPVKDVMKSGWCVYLYTFYIGEKIIVLLVAQEWQTFLTTLFLICKNNI